MANERAPQGATPAERIADAVVKFYAKFKREHELLTPNVEDVRAEIEPWLRLEELYAQARELMELSQPVWGLTRSLEKRKGQIERELLEHATALGITTEELKLWDAI